MADEIPDQGEGPEGGPVHYQISITGRQAGAFFLTLLVALGLSFFLGMKTGAAARRGPDAVTTLAGASDIPVPTLTPEERAPGESAPAPTPEPSEKKLGFEDAPPATPTPEPAPEPTATPRPTAPPATPKAAERPEKAKPAAKGFFVQVLATKDGKKADELVKRLKKQGMKADVSVSPKSPDLFVVRVGPYGDRPKADAARKKLVKANKELKDSRVVPA